ncbi:MAG TPA: C25 family cysteine peptidase [Chitinophagaceae bacterium]|nr:C25 family cysteine peptidase [Chitinophagaceae bacterium]
MDKLIISNRTALQNKYGKPGAKKIQEAVKKLIAADKKRHLKSLLVFADDMNAMKKVKGKVVTDPTDPAQYKNAIDDLFRYYTPDYIMLLGAQDVVPHCKFRIPIPDDDDTFVSSDVPYACEALFSRKAGDFIAPGRVLGRLPDITGASDPSYLLKLIDNSIRWKPLKLSAYKNYFSLSVKWWKKSTEISVKNIFQDNSKLQLAPATLGPYTKAQLGAMMHFFNCHGGLRTAEFYGQATENSTSFPVCLETKMLADKISYGTVVAAECCYGGLLYNPNRPTKIDPPIINAYLQNGAIGFVGSTTAAYGPADSQGGADYITQYFLIALQKGASCGRAFLEAQQRFVEKGDVKMDPTDLKTIIQFLLLGDPSITPVEDQPKTTPGKTPVKSIMNKDVHDVQERKDRRFKLAEKSVFINSTTDAPTKIESPIRGSLKAEIRKTLKSYKFIEGKKISCGFKKRKLTNAKAINARQDYRYHVFSDVKRGEVIDTLRLLVIQEVDKKVMEVKEYVRR